MPCLQVITANRLNDGRVVYWDNRSRWNTDLQAAQTLTETADADAALAAVDAAIVVEPYLIDVERDGARLSPLLMRERMRATGPTVTLPAEAGVQRRNAA
jgi:hypothetical protein